MEMSQNILGRKRKYFRAKSKTPKFSLLPFPLLLSPSLLKVKSELSWRREAEDFDFISWGSLSNIFINGGF
ncbi:hypothetical protein L6452_43508 [Arctium lappa]|uniref:Uncharacterized protein n=1 Tax=Arctium lappa TaxID=4217 RepID=A0ACB8XCQ7_ARCLA|nr:hypothetical protein L6452_43508 [Arctium lappa]